MMASIGKAYQMSLHARAWLQKCDCEAVHVKGEDSEIKIQALGAHIRITGLAMGFFVKTIIGFSMRLGDHGKT